MLENNKAKVRGAYKRKVSAWNKLISNPYTKANELEYYKEVELFEKTVDNLVNRARLEIVMKAMGV